MVFAKQWTDEQIELVKKLRAEQVPIRTIAAQLGKHENSVGNLIAEWKHGKPAQLHFTVTPEQKSKLDAAAEKCGLPLTTWIRMTVLKAADSEL